VKKVTVVIPTRGKTALVRQSIKSLFMSGAKAHAELDVVVIEQGGTEVHDMIAQEYPDDVRWERADDDWGYSKMNNVAASDIPPNLSSDYILLLNNDTICRQDFLKHMLDVMNDHEDVGIVGAKLLMLDGTLQHIGIVFKSDGVPYHLLHGRKDDGTLDAAERDDYFDAVTFACALIRRSTWEAVGGMTEEYHFNYEDVDFCMKAREKGIRSYVAHRAKVVHLEAKSLGLRRHPSPEKHTIWRNLKIFRDKWITTGKLRELTGIHINKHAPTLRDDKLNIAFVPSAKFAGVPWWRMDLPARKLAKKNLANVTTLHAELETPMLLDTLEKADIAHFQGFTQEWLLRMAKMERPFRMSYDYDDHPIYISPLAAAYRFFGTQEIQLSDHRGPYWLWRDGEAGFDIQRNLEHRTRHLEILATVDMVTTSTYALQQYFSTLNPNGCALLPNSIDFDIYQHQFTLWEKAANSKIRIGWHGGDNHFHDIKTIASSLVNFVNNNDVELVMFGAYYKSLFGGIDESKVIVEDWVHIEAFPYKLATVGIDVGLIPLADPSQPHMQFNRYKSNIKFLEYGAMRIPSLVVAGPEPYATCRDEENALTYTTREEFLDKLARLVSDADLRKRIGTAALDYTHTHFDLDKNCERWLEVFTKLAEEPEAERPAASNAVAEGATA
jgi:GT2 family glycosyltransferase